MSSGVYKFGVGYSYKDEDKRVIDSNALVADRLEQLSAKMQQKVYEEPTFGEAFAAGLDSVAVERLLEDEDVASGEFSEGLFNSEELSDSEGGASGNVIKAMPMPSIDIEAEKEKLLADARAEAEEIINSAMSEAEGIKNDAYEQGRAEGYDEGIAMASEEYQGKLRELEEKARELDQAFEAKIDELEPLFVESLTDIYEHIIHVDFAEDKNIIFHLIRDAVRKVDGSNDFIIHVSKEDYGFVSMQKKELLSGILNAGTAEIIEDMTLSPNECFIETGGGIFDCSLETQLSGLKRELRMLSYVKDN